MCANYYSLLRQHASLFDMPEPSFEYREDIYPGYSAPLIFKNKRQPIPQWEWREAIFGLVPKWAKDSKVSKHTYNARSESIAEKPSFKTAWHKSQFCLIPAEKIYEPRYVDGKAQRWGIQRVDETPFTLAGLYEIAKINDQIIRSFTLITINADGHPLLQQFNKIEEEKRSVVIIPPQLREHWLSANYQTANQMLSLLNSHEYKSYFEPKPFILKENLQSSLF